MKFWGWLWWPKICQSIYLKLNLYVKHCAYDSAEVRRNTWLMDPFRCLKAYWIYGAKPIFFIQNWEHNGWGGQYHTVIPWTFPGTFLGWVDLGGQFFKTMPAPRSIQAHDLWTIRQVAELYSVPSYEVGWPSPVHTAFSTFLAHISWKSTKQYVTTCNFPMSHMTYLKYLSFIMMWQILTVMYFENNITRKYWYLYYHLNPQDNRKTLNTYEKLIKYSDG